MTGRFLSMQVPRVVSAWVLAIILSCVFIFPAQARSSVVYADLQSFVESVRDGDSQALRGVYVQGLMAFQIVQQPAGSPGFVSQDAAKFTQFNMAAEAGNVGLLAHNYLAGKSLAALKKGDMVYLVYGDGRTESFVVTEVLKYQALDPRNTSSDFKNLDTQVTSSARELFGQVYRGDRHITFQTCIEENGDLSWGRLFVVAMPVTDGSADSILAYLRYTMAGFMKW